METALQQSAAATAGGGMRPAGAATTGKKARQELELEQERELRFPQAAAAADQGGLDEELRRGPWTVDEDLTLINYIADHGEGRWNALARAAGTRSFVIHRIALDCLIIACAFRRARKLIVRRQLADVDDDDDY